MQNLSYDVPKSKKLKKNNLTQDYNSINEKFKKFNLNNMINKIKNKLIGIDNFKDYEIIIKFLNQKLINKNEKLENYFKSSIFKKNTIFNWKFNLLNFIKIQNVKNNFFNKRDIFKIITEKNKNKPFIYNKYQRKRAIKKYIEKKPKRKNAKFIRYKVRQELAENRGRLRGKFIKRKRIDLKKAHEDFLKEKKLKN